MSSAAAPATVRARFAHLGWSGYGGEEGNRRRWHGEALWRSCRCGGGLVRRRRAARPPDTDGDGELRLSSATEPATTNGGHWEDRKLTLIARVPSPAAAWTETPESRPASGGGGGGSRGCRRRTGRPRLDSVGEEEADGVAERTAASARSVEASIGNDSTEASGDEKESS